MNKLRVGLTVLVTSVVLSGQGVVVGTAIFKQPAPFELDPYPLRVAPGQVLTLLVAGLNMDGLRSVSSPGGTVLPFELGGVSASVVQLEGATPKPIPLVELRLLSSCPWFRAPIGGPCAAALVGLTIQIPYDLQPQFGSDFKEFATQISIKQGGRPGTWVDIRVLPTQAHFGIQCEGHLTAPSVPCGAPLITHADGTIVNWRKPASPGEVVSAYMLGLGKLSPQQPAAGVPAPVSPLVSFPGPLDQFSLYYAFRPSYYGRPFSPAEGENASGRVVVSFAGLSPGSIGLYQVNFTVPTPPDSLQPCPDTNASPRSPPCRAVRP